MKCSCPKCHAEFKLELPQVDEAGTPSSCPQCRAHFVVHKESFAARVLRRSGQISCASCGNILGPQTFCPSCGTNFPDYLVISLGRKAIGRATKSIKLTSSPFTTSSAQRGKLPVIESLPVREVKKGGGFPLGAKQKVGRYQKQLVVAACVSLLLVLIAGGWMYWNSHVNKNVESYTKNFVRATYCMQSGAEKSFKVCSLIAADWKARLDAGQSSPPRVKPEDEKMLQSIKNQVANLMQQLNDPPKKYRQGQESLQKLYLSYQKATALALDPGPSLPGLVDSATKMDIEYRTAGKEFRAGLPDELRAELKSATPRHPSLKTLFD